MFHQKEQFPVKNQIQRQEVKRQIPGMHKFSTEECKKYLEQLVSSPKSNSASPSSLYNYDEFQPQNQKVFKVKKPSIFSSLKSISKGSKKTLRWISFPKGEQISSQKSLKQKSGHYKQRSVCIPLSGASTQFIEKSTAGAIDILRGAKQREEQLKQKQKDKKLYFHSQQQRVKTIIAEKSKNELVPSVTFNFDGTPLPIIIEDNSTFGKENFIEMKINLNQNKNDYLHTARSKKRFQSMQGQNKSEKAKSKQQLINNKVRVSSLHVQSMSHMEIYCAQNSDFLKNFTKIRFNSKVNPILSKDQKTIIKKKKMQKKNHPWPKGLLTVQPLGRNYISQNVKVHNNQLLTDQVYEDYLVEQNDTAQTQTPNRKVLISFQNNKKLKSHSVF